MNGTEESKSEVTIAGKPQDQLGQLLNLDYKKAGSQKIISILEGLEDLKKTKGGAWDQCLTKNLTGNDNKDNISKLYGMYHEFSVVKDIYNRSRSLNNKNPKQSVPFCEQNATHESDKDPDLLLYEPRW